MCDLCTNCPLGTGNRDGKTLKHRLWQRLPPKMVHNLSCIGAAHIFLLYTASAKLGQAAQHVRVLCSLSSRQTIGQSNSGFPPFTWDKTHITHGSFGRVRFRTFHRKVVAKRVMPRVIAATWHRRTPIYRSVV